MLDELLERIFFEYYKPTDHPWAQTTVNECGRAYVDHNKAIPEAAGQVNKHWREESLKAQRKSAENMRTAFFAEVVDMVQLHCLDDGDTRGTKTGLCLLRHTSVTHTVVKTTFYSYWTQPRLDIWVHHYPVDRNQDELVCFHSTPKGLQRTPTGFNHKYQRHLLGEMPHFHVRDKDRTEDQKAEAQAWLVEFGRVVVHQLWRDFHVMNDNDWHRQRFWTSDQEADRREDATGASRRRGPVKRKRV